MVMVALSTTLCLYTGYQDVLNSLYPTEYEITMDENADDFASYLQEQDIELKNLEALDYFVTMMMEKDGTYQLYKHGQSQAFTSDEIRCVYFVSIEDYNRTFSTSYSLKENEILTDTKTAALMDSFDVFNENFEITGSLLNTFAVSKSYERLYPVRYVFVNSKATLEKIWAYQNEQIEDYTPSSMQASLFFDTDASVPQIESAMLSYS
jgi:putative ABC transport system permease protein